MGDRCSIRGLCEMTASCPRDSNAQRSSDGGALDDGNNNLSDILVLEEGRSTHYVRRLRKL